MSTFAPRSTGTRASSASQRTSRSAALGISAEACLFADLGLDPGTTGCQSYEATAFLARTPPVDTEAVLVLWQVSVLGRADHVEEPDPSQLWTDVYH